MNATDILVDVGNPVALDETLRALPGVVAMLIGGPEGPFKRVEDHYVVRVFGDPEMFEFMVTNQGYCTVVRRLEKLS